MQRGILCDLQPLTQQWHLARSQVACCVCIHTWRLAFAIWSMLAGTIQACAKAFRALTCLGPSNPQISRHVACEVSSSCSEGLKLRFKGKHVCKRLGKFSYGSEKT